MRLRDTPERRLIQLLCSTAEHRRAGRGEMSALMHEVDVGRLLALLKRTRLLVLVGGRLLAMGGRDIPELERELDIVQHAARRWGAATELAGLEVLDRFSIRGDSGPSTQGQSSRPRTLRRRRGAQLHRCRCPGRP